MAKPLIARDEMGMYIDSDLVIRVDSRDVASVFERDHEDLLRLIDEIVARYGGWDSEFSTRNFAVIDPEDLREGESRAYGLSREGFELCSDQFIRDEERMMRTCVGRLGCMVERGMSERQGN